MKEYSTRLLKKKILQEPQITPSHVLQALPALMNKRSSMALMTMSRSNEANRIKNHTFKTAIQQKLRLPVLDCHQEYRCKCGLLLDAFGDYCLGCKVNHKTKASNGIRDEITKVFQRILPIIKMIDSPTQVEMELHNNIVPSLPRLKPFDLSIRLDHSLDTRCWRTPYSRIGFDVTLIHSTNDSTSSASEASQYNETDLHLRGGEKMKFARRTGGTNPITNKTLSADEVICEILDTNNVFIPIAVSPLREFGSLFRRFIESTKTLPLPSFSQDRPNATRAATLAVTVTNRTPYNVLSKADAIWKESHGAKLFDGSYMSQSLSTWANQRLGLATVTHLANHINTSLTKIKHCRFQKEKQSVDTSPEDDELSTDWNLFGGDLSDTTNTTVKMNWIDYMPQLTKCIKIVYKRS
jgi:hypothetical protein